MSWFTQLCRNVGLMFHNVKNPGEDDNASGAGTERREIKRDVQEKRQGNMILRRTTIDEIEIKRDEE
ncbi:hypothetical protein HED60_07115 [Planctomycetales bacterium ZRK34]|nr:hypothetical protein HED60_07115 [Planctomycetales bacterium ZRK34]